KFKSGSDPYTMYQTLSRGFGLMVPQTWMVPEQKYDVIHYIRETYLKPYNSTQYAEIDAGYLANLPKGDTRGPKPSNIFPWEQMDYGPNLVMTMEFGNDAKNFAYKGNAIRLDHGQGGVSRGKYWMMYDYDTLRVAAGWSGEQFCDWAGINFDGRHNIHPRLTGNLHFANPTGPGWANPADGSFEDVRLVGRDERRYGPLPRTWAQYKGMYYHGNNTLIQYTVGNTSLLELPSVEVIDQGPVFKRTLNIGPRDREIVLQVADRPGSQGRLDTSRAPAVVVLGAAAETLANSPDAKPVAPVTATKWSFNQEEYLQVDNTAGFSMTDADFTFTAKIKTRSNSTIFAKTAQGLTWVRDGKSFFLRGGRLTYDIGWVGAISGRTKITDGQWHHVALVGTKRGEITLYVDGKVDGSGNLAPKKKIANDVLRFGYTSNNFPGGGSLNGQLDDASFFAVALTPTQIATLAKSNNVASEPVAQWNFGNGDLKDVSGKYVAKVIKVNTAPAQAADNGINPNRLLVAGVAGDTTGLEWIANESGMLRLKIPAGDKPLRFTVWLTDVKGAADVDPLVDALVLNDANADLIPFTQGGPRRWPDLLKTKATVGNSDGPFSIDVLTRPAVNPWFCRMRLTGFDFYPDGNRMVVSAWDGSVWLVSGIKALDNAKPGDAPELTWQRICSGLFQPLGVLIVNDNIYVTCRDQLAILHDLNGDHETDYVECFNNDHQVTDHFHEFAMGLQRDDDGNFYYAKSARHALTALVPHHGTLLRVSNDGKKTDIVANGFRAANGVCLNPDGTFIVTDQEGHWNPKNRINYVKEGGFYGNMFGYHDVTDSSDSAMQQPLCWITNGFDRSPAELLWVDSDRWGPLKGTLLNLSYGYGKVYTVPHEKIDGQAQGGMSPLPIPQFPTGVMRGRFNPLDGQLYLGGMFAWAGSQSQPGGLYRLSYTEKPVHVVTAMSAKKKGLELKFSGKLDPSSLTRDNVSVKAWDLKRTSNYGSEHFNEHPLKVESCDLASDGQTLMITLPEIAPTWCMEIKYRIRASDGKAVTGVIHNTIHNLK
ncbi:MAG: DUF6797 domain-containing protein, partial [Aeoliella sp.]